MATNKVRPTGLTVFAVINLVYAALTGLTFVAMLLLPSLRAEMDVPQLYAVLSPGITSVMLLLSGVGFLRRSWAMGLVGGNILAIGSICNYILYFNIKGYDDLFIQLPFASYYVLLFCFLNGRYKQSFIRHNGELH